MCPQLVLHLFMPSSPISLFAAAFDGNARYCQAPRDWQWRRAAHSAAHFGSDGLYLIWVYKNLDRSLLGLKSELSITDTNGSMGRSTPLLSECLTPQSVHGKPNLWCSFCFDLILKFWLKFFCKKIFDCWNIMIKISRRDWKYQPLIAKINVSNCTLRPYDADLHYRTPIPQGPLAKKLHRSL